MKILLTGGTGFFGGVLKGHLQKAGHDYVNLDRLNDTQDAVAGKMALVDLRDADAMEAAFQKFGQAESLPARRRNSRMGGIRILKWIS